MAMNKEIRLQKYLAQCGVASRRKAETIIDAGRVSVDGLIVTNMGTKVHPEMQKILLDGKPVQKEIRKIYILLNKPKGYVTTLSDPQGRPIVTTLIKNIDARLFPVGRLDLDTTGALILTNDGDFSQKVQHPSFEVTKTYEAHVRGIFPEKDLIKLEKGIPLEGRITAPAKLTIVKRLPKSTLVKITIHEGRKRQVRKMFQAVSYPVINLKRIAYGRLYLGKLPEGSYRTLTQKDLKKVF